MSGDWRGKEEGWFVGISTRCQHHAGRVLGVVSGEVSWGWGYSFCFPRASGDTPAKNIVSSVTVKKHFTVFTGRF